MTNLKTLQKKVDELENRLKTLEAKIASPLYSEDKALMDALYKKAKELVVKHNKASVIFLQRKLFIDIERATRLLAELQANGIVSPEFGASPRKILGKK